MSLSKRGKFLVDFSDKLHEALGIFLTDPYDEKSNPQVI